jgi:hypothetical protein
MSATYSSGHLRLGRVAGYPNYRILSNGSVWSRRGDSWVRKQAFPDKHGYMQLNLSASGRKRRFYLHAVVLMAFVGTRPKGMECRHLDGNKANNHIDNLCWGTSKENAMDKVRHGTVMAGSRRYGCKLNDTDVLEIRLRVKDGKRGIQTNLAKEFGVSDTIISHIVSRKAWDHV